MKLSVIIPVYRVEAYLDKCVQSVLSQSYSNLEVILVDDCSPDRCGEICDSYFRKDNRVRVVHRPKNGGLSAARNSGIEAATGELLTFVDSDDSITADTYSEAIAVLLAHKTACVEFPVRKGNGSPDDLRYVPFTGSNRTETFHDWFARQGYVRSYSCNKIYTRSLWGDTRFPEGKFFEDLYTVPYVLERADRIATTDKGEYFYFDANPNAITNTPSPRKANDLFEATTKLLFHMEQTRGMTANDLYPLYMEAVDRKIDCINAGVNVTLPAPTFRWRCIFTPGQTGKRQLKALLLKLLGNQMYHLFKK